MKVLPLLIAGVLLMGNASAQAQPSKVKILMEARESIVTEATNAASDKALGKLDATIQVEEAVATFDKEKDKLYAKDGTGVMAGLVAAESAARGSANGEMVKLYVDDKLTPDGAEAIHWGDVPKDQRKAAIGYIASKKTIDKGDLAVIRRLSGDHYPELKPREADILGLIPKTSAERYKLGLKLFSEHAAAGNWEHKFEKHIKDQEILDLLGGVHTAFWYDAFRKEMLARCIGAVTRTRRAAKLPNDSKSFDAAMAPILTALNAPLWDGLPAAVAQYGMILTTPDYSGLVGDLTNRCNKLDERKITDTASFAGSMMFWKGVEGYKSWAQQYTED